MTEGKRLYRSDDARLGGVCAGIAEYFGIDATVVRVIAIIITVLTSGVGLLIYIVLLVVLPKKPADFTQPLDVEPIEKPAEKPVGVGPDGRPVGAPVPPVGVANQNTASVPTKPFATAPGNAEAPFTPAGDGTQAGNTAPFTPRETPAQPGTPSAQQAQQGNSPGAGYAATYGAAYDAPAEKKEGDPWYLWPLVIIGLVFVGAGLSSFIARFVPGISWWNFWPLIIVICGLIAIFTKGGKEKWHVERLFSGLSVIVIGLIILGCTTGVLGWGVVFSILSLWPAFLVCLGLVIVGAATHMRFFSCLSSIVFIGVLVWGGMSAYSTAGQNTVYSAKSANVLSESGGTASTVDLGEYQTASLEYQAGGAVCNIEPGRTDGVTVFGNGSYAGGTDLSLEETRDIPLVRVTSGLNDSTDSSATLISSRVRWEKITVKAGASTVNLDARELDISKLRIEAGMADVTIDLGEPAADSSTLELNSGMANNNVTLPAGTPASISVQSAFANTEFTGFSYDVSSGRWVTPGYAEAIKAGKASWNIDVQGGFGSFNIDAG